MNDEENKTEVSASEAAKVVSEQEESRENATEKAPSTMEIGDIARKTGSFLRKNIVLVAAAVVVLILLCLIGSCVSGGKSSFKLVNEKNYYMRADDDLLVSYKGEEIEVEEKIYDLERSADGSLTVVKDCEANLFIVKGDELVEVAEEVYTFYISYYGDTIAYLTDVGNDGEGELHLYQVSNAKDTLITDEAYRRYTVLSEDGKSVAYITADEKLYVSKNGKESEKIASGDDTRPLALTNGAKHVFYIKNENLYMDDKKLASDIDGDTYFNQDCTEIIYMKDGNTYYYAVKMDEPVKVKSGSCYGILAPDAVVETEISPSSDCVYYYGITSFNEQLWNIGDTVYYVYKKGQETDKLGSDITYYQMSETGNSILYQKGSKLMYVADFTKSREGEEVVSGLSSYYTSFVASKDLKTIYYYDSDEDELCYVKKGEGVRIADDVEDFVYSDKYGVVYFIEDDELFYANKTSKSKTRVCDEKVYRIVVVDDEVYFGIKEKNSVIICKMKNKAKYEEVMEIDD